MIEHPLQFLLAGCIWGVRGSCLFFAIEETLKVQASKKYKRPAGWWTAFAFVMGWLF